MYKWGSLAPDTLAARQLKEAEHLSTAIDFPLQQRSFARIFSLNLKAFTAGLGSTSKQLLLFAGPFHKTEGHCFVENTNQILSIGNLTSMRTEEIWVDQCKFSE